MNNALAISIFNRAPLQHRVRIRVKNGDILYFYFLIVIIFRQLRVTGLVLADHLHL